GLQLTIEQKRLLIGGKSGKDSKGESGKPKVPPCEKTAMLWCPGCGGNDVRCIVKACPHRAKPELASLHSMDFCTKCPSKPKPKEYGCHVLLSALTASC